MEQIKTRTPYEQAEPAGKAILKAATTEHKNRLKYSNSQSYQACKEGAQYLVNRSKGKVIVMLSDIVGEKAMDYERVFGHK